MSFLSMYNLATGILLTVLTSILSMVLVFAVRRFFAYSRLKENNEFASITYPVIGLIYGVFLAFAIIIAWGRFSDAEKSVVHEVTYLSELWRDSQPLNCNEDEEIEALIINYVNALLIQWESMTQDENKKIPEHTSKADNKKKKLAKDYYEEIWEFYYCCQPDSSDENEKVFYEKAVSGLNEVGRYRRQRLLFSTAEVPKILWIFLISGGVITISFTFFMGTRHAWLQALISALITALITFSIFLVFSLQHPFSGDVSVNKDHFKILARALEKRVGQQHLCEPTASESEIKK